MARIGMNLKALVSFHGSLDSFHNPVQGDVKSKVLICHGGDDLCIPIEAIENFKTEMNAARVDYKFITYEGALHGFTNPAADPRGKKYGIPLQYNKNADYKSWDAMKSLFE